LLRPFCLAGGGGLPLVPRKGPTWLEGMSKAVFLIYGLRKSAVSPPMCPANHRKTRFQWCFSGDFRPIRQFLPAVNSSPPRQAEFQ
jgi:hypothetical protein